MIRYAFDAPVSPVGLAELRESVGWNRALRPFYERFGFFTMLCGQREMRPGHD